MAKSEFNSDILGHLILLRVLSESGMGVGIDVVRRDLARFVDHRLRPAEWRERCDREVEALISAELLQPGVRDTVALIGRAQEKVELFLGEKIKNGLDWERLKSRDLVALSLGIANIAKPHRRALESVGELRHAIVQSGYGLPIKRSESAASLRNQLAGLALAQGFGANFIDIANGPVELRGRSGRLIAAQLLSSPRSFANDGLLIAQLAAEKAGASGTDLLALREACLRKLLDLPFEARPVSVKQDKPDFLSDLKEFSDVVHILAKESAKGWPGNRRAYISHVWNSIRSARPELELNEGGFKTLLAEAHRAGHVKLINADLRSRKNMADLKASAVHYKNTEWHFIRVDE